MLSTPRRTAFPAAARATCPRPARASAPRAAPPSRRAFQEWLKKSKNGSRGPRTAEAAAHRDGLGEFLRALHAAHARVAAGLVLRLLLLLVRLCAPAGGGA